MDKAEITCWSSRKDSSGTCCQWDCMYLSRMTAEVAGDEKDISCEVFGRCVKYKEKLRVSFGRPKRCFECKEIKKG